MKIAIIIFMVLMTLFTYFGKYLPLEKIKPFFFNRFPERYAKLIFNTAGALLITSCALYLILVFIFILNAPTEIVAALALFFIGKEIFKWIKEAKNK